MESLQQSVGTLKTYAKDVRSDYRKLDKMLTVPHQRGALGEIALEKLISDQLPKELYGIRKQIIGMKIPDAYIKSVMGIICIDSKFPLDNYKKMIESNDDVKKEKFKKEIINNINNHLKKIQSDYIHPELGTAEFACAFIPSEAVYWFLINECYEELNNWAKKGVQVLSPLTLSQKIAIIKAGVEAKEIYEKTEEIRKKLTEIRNDFNNTSNEWNRFRKQFKICLNRVEDLNNAYVKIQYSLDKILK